MRSSRQITIIAIVILLVSMAASVLLLRQVDRIRTGATLEEVL